MSKQDRIRNTLFAAVATASASLALASTAGAVDLRDWGRKFSPDLRFVVLAQFNNQAVLDKETQLVWHRTADSVLRQWHEAHYLCMGAKVGGRMGWRLPSRSEFLSLIDPAISGSIKLPAGHPFTGVTFSDFWTSDPFVPWYVKTAGSPNQMAVINTTGYMHYPDMHSNSGSVWCVRGPGQ